MELSCWAGIWRGEREERIATCSLPEQESRGAGTKSWAVENRRKEAWVWVTEVAGRERGERRALVGSLRGSWADLGNSSTELRWQRVTSTPCLILGYLHSLIASDRPCSSWKVGSFTGAPGGLVCPWHPCSTPFATTLALFVGSHTHCLSVAVFH